MAEIFADNGLIIYMPSNEIPTNPYWKAFMQVAGLTETMDIVEGEEDFVVFRDEDEDILAIQMPEPVDEYQVPSERIINMLRAVIDEEELTDLLEHVREVKASLV